MGQAGSKGTNPLNIAIVGHGCMLPEAANASAYWQNIQSGRCSIRPMPEDRLNRQLYAKQRSNDEEHDRTYGTVAGFVHDESIRKAARANNLDLNRHSRLQVMAMEATSQALAGLDLTSMSNDRTALVFGCMSQDEGISIHEFLKQREAFENILADAPDGKKYLDQMWQELRTRYGGGVETVLTNAVLDCIKERYGFAGQSFLVDAACASSLAALDLATLLLRTQQYDTVIMGGLESNLSPETFVLFANMGLLSNDRCSPLDQAADGMNQGEGAVTFVLKRVEDLDEQEFRRGPYCIRSLGSSSNGRTSSLFSPYVDGQTLAAKQAWAAIPDQHLDYIECHATGTRIGDTAELNAMNNLCKDLGQEDVPVGSVKSQIGHTKGAAGAAGLLKALLILKHGEIPPTTYFKGFLNGAQTDQLTVADKPRPLPNKSTGRIAVNSGGFGGINYHVIIERLCPAIHHSQEAPPKIVAPDKMIGVAYAEVANDRVQNRLHEIGMRVPPATFDHIELAQMQAMVAVHEAATIAHLDFSLLDRSRIGVISTSVLGIPVASRMSKRVRHQEFLRYPRPDDLHLRLWEHRLTLPIINEDTGPGSLNNVIAGRVCNAFDIKGPNFNIDADKASDGAGIWAARNLLASGRVDMVLLIMVSDDLSDYVKDILRGDVTTFILTTDAIAKSWGLPTRVTFDQFEFEGSAANSDGSDIPTEDSQAS